MSQQESNTEVLSTKKSKKPANFSSGELWDRLVLFMHHHLNGHSPFNLVCWASISEESAGRIGLTRSRGAQFVRESLENLVFTESPKLPGVPDSERYAVRVMPFAVDQSTPSLSLPILSSMVAKPPSPTAISRRHSSASSAAAANTAAESKSNESPNNNGPSKRTVAGGTSTMSESETILEENGNSPTACAVPSQPPPLIPASPPRRIAQAPPIRSRRSHKSIQSSVTVIKSQSKKKNLLKFLRNEIGPAPKIFTRRTRGGSAANSHTPRRVTPSAATNTAVNQASAAVNSALPTPHLAVTATISGVSSIGGGSTQSEKKEMICELPELHSLHGCSQKSNAADNSHNELSSMPPLSPTFDERESKAVTRKTPKLSAATIQVSDAETNGSGVVTAGCRASSMSLPTISTCVSSAIEKSASPRHLSIDECNKDPHLEHLDLPKGQKIADSQGVKVATVRGRLKRNFGDCQSHSSSSDGEKCSIISITNISNSSSISISNDTSNESTVGGISTAKIPPKKRTKVVDTGQVNAAGSVSSERSSIDERGRLIEMEMEIIPFLGSLKQQSSDAKG